MITGPGMNAATARALAANHAAWLRTAESKAKASLQPAKPAAPAAPQDQITVKPAGQITAASSPEQIFNYEEQIGVQRARWLCDGNPNSPFPGANDPLLAEGALVGLPETPAEQAQMSASWQELKGEVEAGNPAGDPTVQRLIQDCQQGTES